MRRWNIATLASKTGANGTITAEEVRVLSDNLFNGEEVWPPEVRALLALLHRRLPACAAFDAFIVEALSEYTINQLEPRGSVDEKNARWLIAMLRQGQDGWSEIELAVVRAVLEKAGGGPVALQRFALEVAQHVLAGGRPGHYPVCAEPEQTSDEPIRINAESAPAAARRSAAA